MFSTLSILSATTLYSRTALGSVAYCQNSDYASGALGVSPFQTYNAAPFAPVQLNYALPPADCPYNKETSGYFFFAPLSPFAKQPGSLIMNPDGTLVHYFPNFARGVVQYKGEDHLGFFVGAGSPANGDHGYGYNLLLNKTYQLVANITTTGSAGNLSDFHEFNITSNDTALMTSYPLQSGVNLTSFGGPSDGYVYNSAAQEVDIETGEAIFTWLSLDHVDPSECYVPLSSGFAGRGTAAIPWDYFHINSIQKLDDGNYLISSRHCHTLYLVKPDGDIIWRMGGKNSSFVMGEGTNFSWQHHARIHGAGDLTVFNNAATTWEEDADYSQGLELHYDESAMTVSLISARLPFNRTVSTSQGDLQVLEGGSSIVGWGEMPWFSAHDPNGSITWAAQYAEGGAVAAYRVTQQSWVGRPSVPPSMNISSSSTPNNVTVYAWWNGATEVTSWALLGSQSSSPLSPVVLANASKTDFETTITYSGESSYEYFQVVPMNVYGQTLSYSNFTSMDGTTLPKADNQTATAPAL